MTVQVQELENILEERDLSREEVISLWEEGDEKVIKWLQRYRRDAIGLNWLIRFCDEWAFDIVAKENGSWIHPKTYIFKNSFGKQLYYLKFVGEDAEELQRIEEESRVQEEVREERREELRRVKVRVKTRVGESWGETYIEYYTQDPVYDLFRLLGQATDSRRLNDLINILESSEFHFGTEWAREKEKELAELLELEQVEVELEVIGHTKKKEEGWHLLLLNKPLFVYKNIDEKLFEEYVDMLEEEFHNKLVEIYGKEEK